jgi:hypothetical protein
VRVCGIVRIPGVVRISGVVRVPGVVRILRTLMRTRHRRGTVVRVLRIVGDVVSAGVVVDRVLWEFDGVVLGIGVAVVVGESAAGLGMFGLFVAFLGPHEMDARRRNAVPSRLELRKVPTSSIEWVIIGRLGCRSSARRTEVQVEPKIFAREEIGTRDLVDLCDVIVELDVPRVVVSDVDVLAVLVVEEAEHLALEQCELGEGVVLSQTVVGVAKALVPQTLAESERAKVRSPVAKTFDGEELVGLAEEVVMVLQHGEVGVSAQNGRHLSGDSRLAEIIVVVPVHDHDTRSQ